MNDYTFTFRFLVPEGGLDSLSSVLYDQVDDASLMGPDEDGSYLLEFDRQAPDLPTAVTGARDELARVLPDATLLRLEEDDLPTITDIAKRARRSPESVRLLILGQRGPGGFPPAAGRLDARTRVWRWSDVAEWFESALGEPLPDTADAAFVQAFNDALELRRLSGRLDDSSRVAIEQVLGTDLNAA
jgi:hypothetical protein